MPSSKAIQELQADLLGAASDLRWAAKELLRVAERLSLAGNDADAQTVMRLTMNFCGNQERLEAYADEIKTGRLMRAGPAVSVGSS
ncbi:hypothetical protein [Pseudomonas sp. dw_358]|uniref:hypothetical protein n=1 Tax=Pseudomonas sp. dw_358 TaxID=2720083 RepID=UPI001BD5759C|nr:hypothetical protein [Pseudomonas sp. dw_358]